MQEIKINDLEEIAVGKTINGEMIISNRNNKISTVVQGTFDGVLGILRRKNDYQLLEDNTLHKLGGRGISEKEYNTYLNSIKEK